MPPILFAIFLVISLTVSGFAAINYLFPNNHPQA